MNPVTARTLLAASVISLAIGLMTASPSARFFLAVLSALLAAAPAVSGKRPLRIAAAALLLLSLSLAAYVFPSFRADQHAYRERAVKTR